jgi:para-nitrobenzyl esterase
MCDGSIPPIAPLLSLMLISLGHGHTANPIVSTSLGLLRGVRNGQVEKFLGIRYAQQPQRFEVSEPDTTPWSGIRNSTQHAKRCWEPKAFPCVANASTNASMQCKADDVNGMSEDCLFLDIYRPSSGTVPHKPMAVMVWIHGGGMTMGDSMQPNVTQLAPNQGVVVVSLNYRLGPLGFLPVRSFGSPDRGSGGMNGQNDQIVALKWLKRHIASFGGDPDRMTIFGCSAGGLSVCALSVSPRAAGLFRRAAIQSGPCLGPWGPGTFDEGEAVTQRVMASLGTSTVADLIALPPWSLMWAQGQDQYDIEFPGYWVDGWVSPEHPSVRIRAGLWHPDALLLGATSRDGVLGDAYVPKESYPTEPGSYASVVQQRWRPLNDSGGTYGAVRTLPHAIGSDVAAAYPLDRFISGGGAAGAFHAADGDYNVVCPTREIAHFATIANIPAYLYYFTHGPWSASGCKGVQPKVGKGNQVPSSGWAEHGWEQYLVFDIEVDPSVKDGKCHFTPEEKELSNTMQTFWANFAKYGEPRSANLSLDWIRYGVGNAAFHLDVGGLTMIPDFGTAKSDTVNCSFWLEMTRGYNATNYVTRLPVVI